MPKKTRTINQGRRAINAIISNIIGADCKKLQNPGFKIEVQH